MGQWENRNENNEKYTPKYIFEALECVFDMDVASPVDRKFCHVPASQFITEDSLNATWNGFVWMNPPYSGKKTDWMDKIYTHGNGLSLMPDRTSAPWWPRAARQCDALLLVTGKIKFINADGTIGEQPANGSTLFGYGKKAIKALLRAQENKLGIVMKKYQSK